MKNKGFISVLAVVLAGITITSCTYFITSSNPNSGASTPPTNENQSTGENPGGQTGGVTGNVTGGQTNGQTGGTNNEPGNEPGGETGGTNEPGNEPGEPGTEPGGTAEPVVESPGQAGVSDQDPEALALAFVENSFAFHSKQLPSDAIDPESKNFLDVYRWRRQLIMERRERFGNAQKLSSLEIERQHLTVDGDRAFMLLRTLETFVYDDEPDLPAQTRGVYAVLLRNTGDAWKVSWAGDGNGLYRMAQGAGQTSEEAPERNFARYGGIYVPFVSADTATALEELDLALYADADIFGEAEAFPYADLAAIATKERAFMDEDEAALAKALPTRSFQGDSGLHAFDREAMEQYITRWAMDRNPEWGDFSPYGGDCQNFASQVMLTGGAQMVDQWYFRSWDDRMPAWSGVPWMTAFITENRGAGPQGERVESWSELEIGDMIHIDWTHDGGGDHATVVITSGPKARIAGHSTDAMQQRVSDIMGQKINLHLLGYQG